MTAPALFCAPGAGRHQLTIEQVEDAGLTMAVADCPDHPHTPTWPAGTLNLTWPDDRDDYWTEGDPR